MSGLAGRMSDQAVRRLHPTSNWTCTSGS